jgi:hypothetical protein
MKHLKKFEQNIDKSSSDLSNGFYWIKLKSIKNNEDKKSKWSLHMLNFAPKIDNWMIGYILNGSILIDGNPYPLDLFEIDNKIER